MRAKYQFIILQFLEKTAKMTLVTLSFQHGRNFPKKHKKMEHWLPATKHLSNYCILIPIAVKFDKTIYSFLT